MIDTYTKDGVNVAAGDEFSAFAARECAKTSSTHVDVTDWSEGHFRGPRTVAFVNVPDGVEYDNAADGPGSKPIVTVEANTPLQAGYDLVAMTCGDITRWGGKPIMICNVLDVATLGEPGSETDRFFRRAIIGLCDACLEARILAYRGETAELGVCVGSENDQAVAKYNWAGFATGIYHPSRMITGKEMKPGDVVVALKEDGFRSNGLSSVRAALRERFGEKWWLNPESRASVGAAAVPSKLYDKFLSWCNGWTETGLGERVCDVKCIAHVSGGGIPGKFAKDILFQLGLSADLSSLWEPPIIMRRCAQWRGMNDRQIFKTFNGGQGVLAVMSLPESEKFTAFAGQFGIRAQRCGLILPGGGSPRLTMLSKFSGKIISFTPEDEDL